MTFVMHFLDRQGDLVEQEWFDSAECLMARMVHYFPELIVGSPNSGHALLPDSTMYSRVEWGRWPCGTETDYDMYCAHCGDLMWEGVSPDV